ncbi:hypothetical protein MWN33_18690 [Starkeya koreensis]|uniref:Uncharacterized protein n=1 Tax=Ancylobacter koreensis TaxID=266121 RepID=A0ABT0DSA9_9HYPH|nr:hypothetical protein [Ancylobacter koreensis]MCK0210064.1 hypothetical protein [Ancylobacter koreensis]
MARLPGVGSVWVFPADEPASSIRKAGAGWIKATTGPLGWEFAMPTEDDGCAICIPHQLRPALHYPWCALGVPALLIALVPSVSCRALLGHRFWRLRRPWLRLMWRLRPQAMARIVHAREEKERADAAEYRRIKAEWDAAEAAREAKREAAFEAEVERRLALRLASDGA